VYKEHFVKKKKKKKTHFRDIYV